MYLVWINPPINFTFSDDSVFLKKNLGGDINSLNLLVGVRVLMTFHLMCVHIIFSLVWVAEWPPFGKELLPRLTICFLCILTTSICNFSHFPFWF